IISTSSGVPLPRLWEFQPRLPLPVLRSPPPPRSPTFRSSKSLPTTARPTDLARPHPSSSLHLAKSASAPQHRGVSFPFSNVFKCIDHNPALCSRHHLASIEQPILP